MSIEAVFSNFVERSGVKTIFGEPVSAGGMTVVPVAKVAYGFGGGQGTGHLSGEEGHTGEGSGGGGGFAGMPVGYIEIGPNVTRFVHIGDKKRLALALALGAVVGAVLARRR